MAYVRGAPSCAQGERQLSARKPWADRGSRHARGYGSHWDKLRLVILRRDNHLCQSCLAKGRPTPANHVDHIRPKSKGGTDDHGNLQSLCQECHDEKTAQEDRRHPSKRMKRDDEWLP